MKQRIALATVAIGTAVTMLPLLAAFEAHVINVTATIENALSVNATELNYGTVFPQEALDKTFNVALSGSFVAEGRVDDVSYFLRQKPKCGLPVAATDPVQYSAFEQVTEDANGHFICPHAAQGYVVLPLLCPYLSKHEIKDPSSPNEVVSAGQSSFHGPINADSWTETVAKLFDVQGHLAKSEHDTSDTWDIDLHVPCFAGQCAQDWAHFVTTTNPLANPDNYIQPKANEHKLFGCDLWLEVGGISVPGIGCSKQADMMLVLDDSGSIGGNLPVLQSAASAFVTAVAPSTAGVHMGEVSFASDANLDQPLTDNGALVQTAIANLVLDGTTDLVDAIILAQNESTGGNGRPDVTSPNFMVIITDGAPNVPDTTTGPILAAAAAAAAKAAGTTIFVVGVGTDAGTSAYLQTEIATDAAHYFDAANFSDLSSILAGIAACNNP